MNQNINAYRIGIRGGKWWWCLFTWMIDVSMQNAWIIARTRETSCDQLSFRREVAMSYIRRFGSAPKGSGKKKSSVPCDSDARYDDTGHLVKPVAAGVRRRCAGDLCESQVKTQCVKCDIGLCVSCFMCYHKK